MWKEKLTQRLDSKYIERKHEMREKKNHKNSSWQFRQENQEFELHFETIENTWKFTQSALVVQTVMQSWEWLCFMQDLYL